MNAKTDTQPYAELEQWIPDYLNGHASKEQQQAIEKAMTESLCFRRLMESERALFAEIRESSLSTSANPKFSDIAHKVNRRASWFAPAAGWSVAAACALLLLVGVGNWGTDQIAFDDFETLSQEPLAQRSAGLRIIGVPGVSMDELRLSLKGYGLEISRELPSLGVIEVILPASADFEGTATALSEDRRVRSVSKLEASGQ